MNRYKKLLPLAIIAVMACGCSRIEDKGETANINTTTVASDNQTVEFSTIYETDESEDVETTPEAVTQSDTEESIPSETQTEPQSEEETLPEATAEETTAITEPGFEANLTTVSGGETLTTNVKQLDETTPDDETAYSQPYSDASESESGETFTTTEGQTTEVFETATEPETTKVPETTKSGVILLPEVPI